MGRIAAETAGQFHQDTGEAAIRYLWIIKAQLPRSNAGTGSKLFLRLRYLIEEYARLAELKSG
jgi:hypothetical protein